jgi:hypothetical protein
MKNKMLLATAILGLSVNVATAAVNQPVPNHCPSVAALTTAPITLGQIDFNTNTYVTAAYNNTYDTDATWMLVVGNIQASGATDAINKATAAMPSFVLDSAVPQRFMDAWACGYQSDKGYQVMTITSNSNNVRSLKTVLNGIKF